MTAEMVQLTAALSVCAAAAILSGLIASGLLRIVFARLHKKDASRYAVVKKNLHRPVVAMVITGVFRAAVPYMNLPVKPLATAQNVLASAFLTAAFWALYRSASLGAALLLRHVGEGGRPADATAANFLTSAVRIAVAVFGILTVLSRWVENITGLVAGLGIGGLALALAAQDTASNLFGSISLLLDRPFEVGDWIEASGIEGTVERIGMRSSRIRTADQSLVFLPNSKLASQSIKNCSKRGKRRIAFKIGVVPDTEAASLQAFLNRIREILKADSDILPDVTVSFDSFGDTKLGVQIGYFTSCTDTVSMLRVNERINFKLLELSKELGIHP